MANLDATNSSMPEVEIHEEIGRRTIQITDLKEELWDLRDRVNDADHRSGNLVQALGQTANEIGVRKSAANKFEDKAALLEGDGEEQVRNLKRLAADAREELQQIQDDIIRIEEESTKALAQSFAEKQRAEQLHVESASCRAKLEAARGRVAHERYELSQDEAAEEARRRRAEKSFEQQEAEGREELEKSLLDAVGKASRAKSEVLRLEKALLEERGHHDGIKNANRDLLERHKKCDLQCEILSDAIEKLRVLKESRLLEDELAATRLDCQRLSQEVANIQNENSFRRQGLQGALDETRRMMVDHLEKTQAVPVDPGLDILANALAEAKRVAAEQEASATLLEAQCRRLNAEVQEAEDKAAKDAQLKSDDQERRITELTSELQSAETSLKETNLLADGKLSEVTRNDAKTVEFEKAMKQKEAFLRKKLVELWRSIQSVK